MASGEYQFVAWVRTGMGALLAGATHDVHLDLGNAGSVTVPVSPYGPGDASGLGAGAVVRTVPASDVSDFEPNLFPAIELAHPALPWMLSPPADALGRVTPWLVLVVVEERAGVALDRSSGLTILTIDTPADPARELPDLAQAWAWAHAQAVGTVGDPLDTADLARSRGEGRARLIAPRRLVGGARYLACLVPAFAAGVAAALGLPIPTGNALAWTTPASAPIHLPVFHAWRFGTAEGGDFASLAARLTPYELAASVGHASIDASVPGWGMPAQPGTTIDVPGALVSPKWVRSDPSAGEAAIGDAILAAIDAAADAPANQAPVYPPAFYGSTATRTARTADSPAWQDALNRDLDQRVAAGLGAAVVRAAQDELVDAAWREAGEAERATIVIRQTELAVAVTQRLVARHIAALPEDGEVLGIARPALARVLARPAVVDGARPTIRHALEQSAMPTAALSPSLRRLARPGGAIARRAPVRAGVVLERADTGAIQSAPPVAIPDGAAAFDAISKDERVQARWRSASVDAIREATMHWHGEADRRRRAPITARRRRTDLPDAEADTTPPLVSDDPDVTAVDEFAAAARRHQGYLYGTIHPPHPLPPLGEAGGSRPLAVLRASIVASLAPGPAQLAVLRSRIAGVASATLENFESVLVRPVFERPLIQALAKLDPEHVLPNVGTIEVDKVAIALPDPAMVRAFLVGANDELGRELLWRGFPGALGHTWLRTFWGRTTFDATGRAVAPDIAAIEAWPDAGPAIEPAQLVLVVRGELLRRYPNTLVYAVAARWSGNHRVIGGGAPMVPAIAQTIATDVALFGFDLDQRTVIGGDTPGGPAGWYFVIEEHPAEPRFGLAATSSPLTTWQELSWFDVQSTDLAGEYLRTDGPLAQRHPTADGGLTWGRDAAQLAAITWRRPTRVAFHASTLL